MNINFLFNFFLCLTCVSLVIGQYTLPLQRKYLDHQPPSERDRPIYADQHRVGYVLNISVGHQGPFQLTFDTGSSNLAVDGKGCAGCVGDDRYDLDASTSAVVIKCQTDQDCQLQMSRRAHCDLASGACQFGTRYVDGSGWNATAILDVVSIGSLLSTERCGLGDILSMSGTEPIPGVNIDGITGWGYASNSAFNYTLWDQIRRVHRLPDVFSMCMSWFGGILSLGFTDSKLINGPSSKIQYTPIDSSRGYYGVDLTQIIIVPPLQSHLSSSISVHRSDSDKIGPIIDTGSTLIHLDNQTYQDLSDALATMCQQHHFDWPHLCGCSANDPSNCWFDVECLLITPEELALWPTFVFVFSPLSPDHSPAFVSMAPTVYMHPGTNPPTLSVWCTSIESGASNINLGDPFFRSTFVTFERNLNRLGFAPQNHHICGNPWGL